MKIKSQFILVTVALITTISVSDILVFRAVDKMDHQADNLRDVSDIQIKQINIDTMHDTIHENVAEQKNAQMAGDTAKARESNSEALKNIDSAKKELKNIENFNLPEKLKQQAVLIDRQFTDYGHAASALMNAGNDPHNLDMRMNDFEKTFKVLEKSQAEYTHDIAEYKKSLGAEQDETVSLSEKEMLGLSILSLLIALSVPIYATKSIFKPQNKMIEAMRQIAGGNTETEIPYTNTNNEIGEMARTVQVFKQNAERMVALAEEQKKRDLEAEEQKRKSMQTLANTFEANVKGVVDMVASAATEMDATSRSVGKIVESSKGKLTNLTGQIESTSRNVQTVASAAAQLSSAVNEINQQITRATTITTSAVEEAGKADITVQSLTLAAGKIGEVVEIINTIAAQINLLALNATIEAARAGDAGKGFAVVASEVKNLATQTTKATEQIAQFIHSIQGATGDTVSAISSIGSKIREINAISTTIAAAVEEQSVATQEIANNVKQASDSTQQVLSHAGEVSRASNETGESATQMIAATGELSRQSELLRGEVDKFLSGVRA